jgi:hypothetical protein
MADTMVPRAESRHNHTRRAFMSLVTAGSVAVSGGVACAEGHISRKSREELDHKIIKLWQTRQELTAEYEAIVEERSRIFEVLPKWARFRLPSFTEDEAVALGGIKAWAPYSLEGIQNADTLRCIAIGIVADDKEEERQMLSIDIGRRTEAWLARSNELIHVRQGTRIDDIEDRIVEIYKALTEVEKAIEETAALSAIGVGIKLRLSYYFLTDNEYDGGVSPDDNSFDLTRLLWSVIRDNDVMA